MRTYIAGRTCLMRLLTESLDDPQAATAVAARCAGGAR